jgi:hypothetical protein
MSNVDEWFPLQPRPDHPKDKVSGSVHLELNYKDLSLPADVQEALNAKSKIGQENLQKLWKEYHAREKDAPLKNTEELLNVLDKARLIEPYLYAADPSLASNDTIYSALRNDKEMMTIFAKEIFNAADADQNGTVDFAELVTAISWQIGGTPEDKIKCK